MVDAASWTARSQSEVDALAGGKASLRTSGEQLTERFRLTHVGDVSLANHADNFLFLITALVEDAHDLALWRWL